MSELLSKISSIARTWIVSATLTWKELLANSISYLSIIPLPADFFPFPVSVLMGSEKQLKRQLLVMHCKLILSTLNLLSGSLCKGVIQGVKEWYNKTSVHPSFPTLPPLQIHCFHLGHQTQPHIEVPHSCGLLTGN